MNKHERFVEQELKSILQPGETVRETAHVCRAPNLLLAALLCGPVGLALLTKHYYAVATERRLIFIRTKMGLFGLKTRNMGVESIAYADIESVSTSGLGNQRKVRITMRTGERRVVRINTMSRVISGTKSFLAQAPSFSSPRAACAG